MRNSSSSAGVVVHFAEEGLDGSEPLFHRKVRGPGGPHLAIAADGVRFADSGRAASQPAVWTEAFRVALANRRPVSEQAQACIRQNLGRFVEDDFVATEGERIQLRQLLTPKAGLHARLREMHACGLLDAMFPEIAAGRRIGRELSPRSAADQPRLSPIGYLESLLGPTDGTRARFGALLDDVEAPELLTLALLLDSGGGWPDDDHPIDRVAPIAPALDRLQLPGDARATVELLIRHRYEMARVAFRRDADDPAIVSAFARTIGSEHLLKMLTLITLADSVSASPGGSASWKEDLLWRLYVSAHNGIALGYADDVIQVDEAALMVVASGRPEDISEQELARFLGGLPKRYLAVFGLSAIYSHLRLARGIQQGEVHTSLAKYDNAWELTVVSRATPALFASITGVLSHFGLSIHRGQVMTTPEGLVLDVFEFSDESGFLREDPDATQFLHATIKEVVSGRVDVATLVHGPDTPGIHRPQRVAPVVRIGNDHSSHYTVLEVVVDDSPALLYRVSRALADEGCAVSLALISTEGRTAIDVLHITRDGGKLMPREQEALKHRLEMLLG